MLVFIRPFEKRARLKNGTYYAMAMSVRLSICPSVRSHETPLLWLVFGTVGNYVAISDYVADHTKRFQTISWNVSTCQMCLIS